MAPPNPRSALFCAVVSTLVVASATAQAPVPQPAASFAVGGATVRVLGDGAEVARGRGRPLRLPATDGLLHLRTGSFDPTHGWPRFTGDLDVPRGGRLFAVQLRTAVLPEYRAAVAALGGEVVGYWPSSAFLVRGGPELAKGLRQRPWVRCVAPLAVGQRLDPKLWPLCGTAGVDDRPREYNVMLALKTDRAALCDAIAAAGGEVSKRNDGSTHVQALLSPRQLAAVAALDSVVWVDATAPIEHDLNNARIQLGVNALEFADGLTGTGVRAQILEGLDPTHPDWSHAPLVQFPGDNDPHGHCTAMIVGGNGSGNTNARGIMPDCQIIESAAAGWGSLSRFEVTQLALDPALPWRVMQQTASWGYTQTTDYNSASAELDDVLFQLDVVATQSQSNTGTTLSRPQAWAKNVISVGGVYHFDNSTPADDAWHVSNLTPASIGPATDGRIKPDVVCYYDSIQCGDLPGAAGYSSTNYTMSFSGTSGATPIVNGCVGLIQQLFTDGAFGNALPLPATAANRFANRPHMTTVKALLCNTAASYAFSGTSDDLTRTHQGWGMPDLTRLWNNRQAMVAVDEYRVLQQGEAHTWYVWVRPGTPEFRATMVYADPPALPSALVHRVNSVDLRVVRLDDGTTWWGNNGLDAGNASTPGGVANDRDTVENVWLPGPQPGIYAVTVSAPTVVQDGHLETPALDVDFALAMHPMGGGYHVQGGLQLDLQSNGPGDLRLQLAGVPGGGWSEGYTLVSFDTRRPFGFGGYFGIEGDVLTDAVLSSPSIAGDVFHIPNVGGGLFPFVSYAAPTALALALRGVTVDAVTVLLKPDGQILEVSNVDRLTLP
jgi:hypothetical protein